MFTNVYGPPLSVFDALPPERKEAVLVVYWKNIALQPLNVRAFEGIDVSSLEVKRNDCGTQGYLLDS